MNQGLDITELSRVNDSKARVITSARPCRLMVANAKGGCGKTTLATNTAAYFAKQGGHVALIDYDPQGSSTQWLQARNDTLPNIYAVEAFRKFDTHATRAFQRKVPSDTSHVIIDTPAGLASNHLSDIIRQSDMIVIPVVPSAIDIRAATGFIKDVLLSPGFRAAPKPIAVVANRVKRNTLGYSKLELFLNSLHIPFVTSLRDTQHYVRAAEYGMGLFDFSQPSTKDIEEWKPLLSWLNTHIDKIPKKSG